jgi:cbb3-type cytochrome oxidase subunit 3
MNKIIIFLLLFVFVCGCYWIYLEHNKPKIEEGSYQGPVKIGDDEQFFRKTGITKPLGDK